MMKIRKANAQDLAQLSELFDGYRQFYRQPADLPGARAFIAERLQQQDAVIFVADSGEALLGFTQLYPSFSSVSMQRLWILNDLFVAPFARQKGAAKALMDAARVWAESTQSKGLILETEVGNLTAQALYDQLGYEQQNATYHYFLAT